MTSVRWDAVSSPLHLPYYLPPSIPATHETRPNVGLLLDQRRRRWANSKPTLDRRLMFAWYYPHNLQVELR